MVMSTTAIQLATLKAMHAKGVLTMTQGGETVTFDSGADLRRRISYLEATLARENGTVRPNAGVTYPHFTKGFDQ